MSNITCIYMLLQPHIHISRVNDTYVNKLFLLFLIDISMN